MDHVHACWRIVSVKNCISIICRIVFDLQQKNVVGWSWSKMRIIHYITKDHKQRNNLFWIIDFWSTVVCEIQTKQMEKARLWRRRKSRWRNPTLTVLPASLALCFSLSTLSLPPAGLTSTSLSTRALPPSPPPEISTDLAAVAMAMMVAVRTICCWVSEQALASAGEWG